MELLSILIIAALIIGGLKILAWLIEAGVWILVLPFKILGGLLALIIGVLFIPFAILWALFEVVVPVLVIGLVAFGIVQLVKQ